MHPGHKYVTSRIQRMEYDGKTNKLWIVLRDYQITLWFVCIDDNEANHLSAKLGRVINNDLEFHYDRTTNEMLEIPDIDINQCNIS